MDQTDPAIALRLALHERGRSDATIALVATLPPNPAPIRLSYATRTGALALLDGVVVGAFDREHRELSIEGSQAERTLELQVERFALPTNRLPSRPGIRWQLMLRGARETPQQHVHIEPDRHARAQGQPGDVPLWGHSHLDVAWLWAYSDTKRKAIRTFANALNVMERVPSFVFMQSQPQLYAYVEESDPAFFERVRAAVRAGRFSPQPAALWVEPDCNLISGESLVRQMLFAHRYCRQRFDEEPSIAWLPDTFGFPNTLPTLLAHAGIPYFATTKLQWNDTSRFPLTRFRWRGPDGSETVSALLDAYEGSPDARRVVRARERDEPLVIGYGDGGGGPTLEQVEDAASVGAWQTPNAWFERIEREPLAVYDDELYLEYHRGTYTTHHDVKTRNAWCERALLDTEERIAWCVAVRAQRDVVERLRGMLREAWEIVLRNQFHDVLPGTSVRSAYVEAMSDYDRAEALLAAARTSCDAMLPRGPRRYEPEKIRPEIDGDEFVFDNGLLHARFDRRGTLVELRAAGSRNVVSQANLLAAYRDRPKKWEAWNLDAGYERHRRKIHPADSEVDDVGLTVRFNVAGSPLTMQISLRRDEPFVRVESAIDWRASRTVLRLENWVAAGSDRVRYGSPHGTISRVIGDPAKFEVPGQRYASVAAADAGFALFVLDTYGWSARQLESGVRLGHSLLRSPRWPDPQSDRGEQRLSWAFAPFASASVASLERAWERYAMEPRVRLFTSDCDDVLVAATKPAEDGDGIVVRLRECNGAQRAVRLRCGARMKEAIPVDGLERALGEPATIEGEAIVTSIPAFGLRAFRVRF